MVAYALVQRRQCARDQLRRLFVARFLDGLPHGAYFGVASLVAASMAPPAATGRAVALVMLGLSVANVVGVPAATWLGQHLGWRAAFWAVTGLSLLTVVLVLRSCRPARATRRRPAAASCCSSATRAGVADAARRRDRLRRPVRRLLLHLPDRHRGRRPAESAVPVFTVRDRPRHGRRHLAGRTAGRLVDPAHADRLLDRDRRGAAGLRRGGAVRLVGDGPRSSSPPRPRSWSSTSSSG